MKQQIFCFIWCIFHEDLSILDKSTANQTLAMTKNVESTKCVNGVINVEVTNDNIKNFHCFEIIIEWSHTLSPLNEMKLYIIIFKMKQL